jgi:hypothetical protein
MSRIEKYTVTRMIDVDGEKVLHALLAQKRTGALTLHIGGGRVGACEWKEKENGNAGGELRSSNHVSGSQETVLD